MLTHRTVRGLGLGPDQGFAIKLIAPPDSPDHHHAADEAARPITKARITMAHALLRA